MADLTDPNVQKVIDVLNKARSGELQAIHQYMVQSYTLNGMDYGQLSAYLKLIGIDEMRHADKFAMRIRALGGLPVCDNAGPIQQPQTVEQIFSYDIDLESATIRDYSEYAEICHKAGDPSSAGLLSGIIKDEEVHLGYYKETMGHIKELGNAFLARYAATSKHSGPIKSFVKLMEKEDF